MRNNMDFGKKLRILLAVLYPCITAQAYGQSLPIKPTRTISFNTNEGTRMDVDVSQDGKTLLFDILGNLYTMSSHGGTAKQITRGMPLNTCPTWSPDGKSIAFISDCTGSLHLNIWNMADTKDRVLGSQDPQFNLEQYPESTKWSANQEYITTRHCIYRISGAKLQLPSYLEEIIGFSPKNSSIYYLKRDSSIRGLYRYDRQKQNNSSILLSIANDATNLTLSPDAHQVAFVADSGRHKKLVVKNIETGMEDILVPALNIKCPADQYRQANFCFSQDNKEIYISYGGKIHRISIDTKMDKVIPFHAQVAISLGPLDYNTYAVNYEPLKVKCTRSANASPDGKHLVFSALDKLYVMDLPDGKPHILADQPFGQFQPVYSNDGKWIAYVSWCDTVGGHLWRVPSLGGQPEQLTAIPEQYQRPAWSPDNETIAIIKQDGLPYLSGGYGTLQLISVKNKSIKTVAYHIPLWNQLTFSKNGQRILYTVDFMNDVVDTAFNSLLVSKDIYTNKVTILTGGIQRRATYENKLDRRFFQQQALSPDGRYLVFSGFEDMYLVKVIKNMLPTKLYDPNDLPKLYRFAHGQDPNWQHNGEILTWSYADKFYRIRPEEIINAKVNRETPISHHEAFDIVDVASKPDQVVKMDITVPKFYAHGTIALKNVRIITMQGDKVVEHGTIIVSDGRIAQVGMVNQVTIPRNAKIYDLKGKTIIPGLIDIHLHMHIGEDILSQQWWKLLSNLAYGVTTARDPFSMYDSFGLAEQLQTGQMTGSRLYSSGAPALIPWHVAQVDDPRDARSIVEQRKLVGGTFMKQYMLPERIQRQWLLYASRKLGVNMTNESHIDLFSKIGQIKDGSTGLEHNPMNGWGDVYSDVITLWARSGTWHTPTLQVADDAPYANALLYFDHKYWKFPPHKLVNFTASGALKDIEEAQPADTIHPEFIYGSTIDARIFHAGGLIGLGCHGNDPGIGPHNELWALQMGGLTNMETLRVGTINGARAIGIQKDVGSIEPGKIADLVILNSSPLDDIHNSKDIKYVMKDGVLYDGDTLDELWPVYKKCQEWRLKTVQTTNQSTNGK